MIRAIPVMDITVDPACQPRIAIDSHIVNEYADEMAGGAEFPPLTVFMDGETHWLADGFHRLLSARKAGIAEVACDVRPGGKRDAILHSVGVNSAHGLRRTSQHKRRAVLTLVNDPTWSREMNDHEIARRCAVSPTTVGTIRSSLSKLDSEEPAIRTFTNKYGTTSTMDTTNIGKAKPRLTTDLIAPGQTLPAHLSTTASAYLFGDEGEEAESVITWSTDDAIAFEAVFAALKVIERDAETVAEARVALNPDRVRAYLAAVTNAVLWQSRFVAHLKTLVDRELGGSQ